MKAIKFHAKLRYGTFLAALGFAFGIPSLIEKGQSLQIRTLLESGWYDE